MAHDAADGRYRTKVREVLAVRALAPGITQTLHGPVPYETGDWILTDPVTNDVWPIKPWEFERRYERLTSHAPVEKDDQPERYDCVIHGEGEGRDCPRC